MRRFPGARSRPSRRAVILAGGKGSRMGLHTTVLPKPLLPIGDRAILDVVVRQLRFHGFTDLTLAVGYLAHLIQAVFGDGSKHDVSITYQKEPEPLGTAAPLAMMERPDDTFLFMNGDVLTTLDYQALLDAHRESSNMLTIASHRRVVSSDYGVMHVDSEAGQTRLLTGYEEKPEVLFTVSMGVYVAEPEVLDFIPRHRHFDVPELVHALLDAGQPVGSYEFDGFWLDIGHHEDYERAVVEFDSLKDALLCEDRAAAKAGIATAGLTASR